MDDPKRITQLTETQSIGSDDYIALDSATGGTKKIKAAYFTGGSGQLYWGGIQGDIEDQLDLAEILSNLIYIDEEGKFYVNT